MHLFIDLGSIFHSLPLASWGGLRENGRLVLIWKTWHLWLIHFLYVWTGKPPSSTSAPRQKHIPGMVGEHFRFPCGSNLAFIRRWLTLNVTAHTLNLIELNREASSRVSNSTFASTSLGPHRLLWIQLWLSLAEKTTSRILKGAWLYFEPCRRKHWKQLDIIIRYLTLQDTSPFAD